MFSNAAFYHVNEKWKIKWGSTDFELLTINFAVNWNKNIEMKFNPQMNEVKTINKRWSAGKLTLAGKIAVTKTSTIPQTTHPIFLPTLSDKYIVLQIYVANKPEKIHRWMVWNCKILPIV